MTHFPSGYPEPNAEVGSSKDASGAGEGPSYPVPKSAHPAEDHISEDVLVKTLIEPTNTIVGAFVKGELMARSTRFRAPWMSGSNEATDRLKLTFQAEYNAQVSIQLSSDTSHATHRCA